MRFAIFSFFLFLWITPGWAHVHHHGEGPPEEIASPVLSPADSQATFSVDPGFRVELVASEPAVEDPVAIAFGPDHTLWVVEMRGFMNDVSGTGEKAPVGRIVTLRDPKGDGSWGERKVFLDGLVLPRAIAVVSGGVLIATPPLLTYWTDTDHDGKADTKIVVATDYGNPNGNPEYQPNGLLRAMDGWIYSAFYEKRFRKLGDQWVSEPTTRKGQWGIAQDNYGRLFYDSNSSPLHADLVPSEYYLANPHLRQPEGIDEETLSDMRVWPSHATPAVNRATELKNGRLGTFTSAAGLTFYRGDLFPKEFIGNAFVCEPAGNLIKRVKVWDRGLEVRAANTVIGREFLTATDPRFRPVNIVDGPDGALYIVDMYRGLIQHKTYLSPALKRLSLEGGYDAGVHRGRIYRIVPEHKTPFPVKDWSQAATPELVQALSHPRGWVRDTAQSLLIDKRDEAAGPQIESLIRRHPGEVPTLHALWTLADLGKISSGILLFSLKDPSDRVRALAIRLAETHLAHDDALRNAVVALKTDPSLRVQHQLLLSLERSGDPTLSPLALAIFSKNVDQMFFPEAWMVGTKDHEGDALETVLSLPDWKTSSPGKIATLRGLSKAIADFGGSAQWTKLLSRWEKEDGWRAQAILEGLSEREGPDRIELASRPTALVERAKSPDADSARLASEVLEELVWPGKETIFERWWRRVKLKVSALDLRARGVAEKVKARIPGLHAAGTDRYETWQQYKMNCAVCHQENGHGQRGVAPPLFHSEWVKGNPEILARIVLNGLHGKISVRATTYELEMPSLASLSDQEISEILTHIRKVFGNGRSSVSADTVRKVRAEVGAREAPWTADELKRLPLPPH